MALTWLFLFSIFSFSATSAESSLSALDFSYSPSFDSAGSHASFDLDTRGGLPVSFTICTAFMIKAWTNGASTSMYVFKAMDQQGKDLISLSLNVAGTSFFKLGIEGGSFTAQLQFPLIFPLDWVHTCMSLEQKSGRINLIVEGTVLDNRTFE